MSSIDLDWAPDLGSIKLEPESMFGEQQEDRKESVRVADNSPTSQEKDEARAYWLHAVARVPLSLVLVALFAPYATLLANLAAGEDADVTGRLTWLGGVNILPTSYVSTYTAIGSVVTGQSKQHQ